MTAEPISADFVAEALDCARRAGVETGALLERAGIVYAPGARYSAEAFGQLWLALAEAMQDEFFGLADRPMPPGSFTLLVHATGHATTLRQALRRALKFLRVVIGAPYGTLRVEDGMAQILLTDADPRRSAFAYRTFWILLHGVTCWYARRRIPLLAVDFACPEPPHCEEYHSFFGAPVRFSCAVSRLAFDKRYLDLPAGRSAREAKAFLRRAPANILVGYTHDAGFQRDIAARLWQTPPPDWPGFEALSRGLGVSPATLRRSLQRQGTSYRDLKEEARLARAKALLTRSGASVAQIAFAVGYAEPSAFFRAFRKRTGLTPGQFRRNRGAG